MRYPLAKPHIGKDEEREVLKALRSDTLSIGTRQEAFEKAFARRIGTKHASAVSSGTAGLHLALLALGIGAGDEVITTPFSFIASANAILYTGARPVFADIMSETQNLDPREIEKKVTKKTKAILVVHIFGQSADMDPIMKIARKHKLAVVEDACESIDARYKGRKVGTFGDASVFSFYPNKQITTGEGGIVATNGKRFCAEIESLRNQGRNADMRWLDHKQLGYNYRMDELSAALGVAQLKKLNFILKERRKIARWYDEALKDVPGLALPQTAQGNTHSWFVYAVRINGRKADRDHVMKKLARRGIATKPYLPAIHLFDFYRKELHYKKGDFPNAENASERSLALPFYIGLTKKDIAIIAKSLAEVL